MRGSARTSGYQEPEGLARLEKETRAFRPTVIFLAYGMNESFGGVESLPGFLRDYDHLLTSARAATRSFVYLVTHLSRRPWPALSRSRGT